MPAVVNLKFPPDDLTRGDAVYSRMHTPVRARRRPRRRKRVQWGASHFLSSFCWEAMVRMEHEHKLLCNVGSSSRQFQGACEGSGCLAGTPTGRLKPEYRGQ